MQLVAWILVVLLTIALLVLTTRTQKRQTPRHDLADEIRGAPKALPARHLGEVAEVQALAWLEGVVNVAAFTLLETGVARSKAEAITMARPVAASWYGVEPDSVPWDGVPLPK